MKKVFSASSREEAKRKADEWWAAQKELQKLKEWEFALDDQVPSMHGDRWTVTVFRIRLGHYEFRSTWTRKRVKRP
jgi:hypothetical protein